MWLFLLLAIRALALGVAKTEGSYSKYDNAEGNAGSAGRNAAGRNMKEKDRKAEMMESGAILGETDIIGKIMTFVEDSRRFRKLVGMAKKPGFDDTSAGNTVGLQTNDITEDLEGNPAELKEAGTYKTLMGDAIFDFKKSTAAELGGVTGKYATKNEDGETTGETSVTDGMTMGTGDFSKLGYIAGNEKDPFNNVRMAKEYLANLMGYYDGEHGTRYGYNPQKIPGADGTGEFQPGDGDATETMLQGTKYEVQNGDQAPLLAKGEDEPDGTPGRVPVTSDGGEEGWNLESSARSHGQYVERKFWDADQTYKNVRSYFEETQFGAALNTTELLRHIEGGYESMSAYYQQWLRNYSLLQGTNTTGPIAKAGELEKEAAKMREEVVGALNEQQQYYHEEMAKKMIDIKQNRVDNDHALKDAMEAHTADWQYIAEQIEQYQNDEREFMKGPSSVGEKTRGYRKELGALSVEMNNGAASLARNSDAILRESRSALRKLDKTNTKILQGIFNDHDAAKRFIAETKSEMKQEKQEVATSMRMLKGLKGRVLKMETKAYSEILGKVKMQKAAAERMMRQANYKEYGPDSQTPALLEPLSAIIGQTGTETNDALNTKAEAKAGSALKKFQDQQATIAGFKLKLASSSRLIQTDFNNYVQMKKEMMQRAVKKHNEAMYTKYADQVRIALSDANMLAKRLANNFHRVNDMIIKKADQTEGLLPARIRELQHKIQTSDEELTGGERGAAGSVKSMLDDFPVQMQHVMDNTRDSMTLERTAQGTPGALTYMTHAKEDAQKKLESYTSEDKRGAYAEMLQDVDTQVGDFKSDVSGQVNKLKHMLDVNKAKTDTLLGEVNAQFSAQISSLSGTIKNLQRTLDFLEKTTVPDLYKMIDDRMVQSMEGPMTGGIPGFVQSAETAGLETQKVQEGMLKAMDADSKKTQKALADYVQEVKKNLATDQQEVKAEYDKVKSNSTLWAERAQSQIDTDDSDVDETSSEVYKSASDAKSMMNTWQTDLQEAKQDTDRMEKTFVEQNDHVKQSAATASERFMKNLAALGLPSDFARGAQGAVDENKRQLSELRDESLETLEASLEKMEQGLYPSERDLGIFNNLYQNVKNSFSQDEILATAASKKLFKQVANLNRGMQTQDIVNAQGDKERLAILTHRTEQLKAELAKKRNDMLSHEYEAAQKAIQDAHNEMATVITEADGWSKGQTDALANAEKKLFAVGGALDHSALKATEEAADEAQSAQGKQDHMLQALVGYQSDVALAHSEEKHETQTEHEFANKQFDERVAAISDAMQIVENDLKPSIESHIDNLNQRWTESMKHWEEREGTMFAPEERQLSDLKARIQDELRTMENALKPMEDRYRAYGDLVTNKKHEADEQEKSFKQKLADENTDFEQDAQGVAREATDATSQVAAKIEALVASLSNVTDDAQATVDDHIDKEAHYGDAEQRMLDLKFQGETSELEKVVGDVMQLHAQHKGLSQWAHVHDAKAAAWRNVVETKLSDMGRNVEEMQSVIDSDKSLAARSLRRAQAKYGDMVQKEMTEEQRRMDKQVQSVYEHTDLLIQQLQANQNLSEAERARQIAELKAQRAQKIRAIHNAAAEAKAAEAEAEAKAQRFKQQVANVVDKLHAQTSGMGGSADVTNRTATAVAAAAEQVHRLSLSPALTPVAFVQEEATDRTTLELEHANAALRAEDAVLEEQLASLRGKLHERH